MEQRHGDPGDAFDQLRNLGEKVDNDWRFVIYCLQKATFELIDTDDETYAALQVDFWSEHVRLLEKEEKKHPGISHQIFVRFEEIAKEVHEAENQHFERELRRQKRKAFVRGMFGLNVEPMTYDEIMASRRAGDGIADL